MAIKPWNLPMIGLQVKETSGAVLIYGLSMQATALHLCGQFQQSGVRASIGLLPGVAGYQVIVHQLGVADVLAMLRQFGVEVRDE